MKRRHRRLTAAATNLTRADADRLTPIKASRSVGACNVCPTSQRTAK
jgi:hypothetical protein